MDTLSRPGTAKPMITGNDRECQINFRYCLAVWPVRLDREALRRTNFREQPLGLLMLATCHYDGIRNALFANDGSLGIFCQEGARSMAKHIFVTGGVVSSLGKGLTS